MPSYRVPEDVGSLVPGARVAAPFGSALATGLVVSLDPPLPPEGTVERDIVAALDDTPFLDERLVKVLVRAAAYYLVPPGELLRAAVPARLLRASEAVYVPTPHSVGAHLEGVAGEILTMLLEVGEARLAELAARAGRKGLASALKQLLADGLVRIRSENLHAASAPSDRAWVARPAPADHPAFQRAPKRRSLHAHLLALGRPVSSEELRLAGGSPAVLGALVKARLVSRVETERRADIARHVGGTSQDRRPVPTAAQRAAIDAITESVR
ncbi:MAG: primosomal protein N' family DNA-binding protein, partial [Thermoanaerobaculia bacterium]